MLSTASLQVLEGPWQATLAADRSLTNLTVQPLAEQHRSETLAFLAERPIHTVFMAGLIRDNGIESPFNRGAFYFCRDAAGRLDGVALVGHATLIEARSEDALIAFARFAQRCSPSHLIRGEEEKIRLFWRHYAEGGRAPRRICRELLFELRTAAAVREVVPGLRLAAPSDLENVMRVNSEMAFEESGVNPLLSDPDGFRQRTLRRIERGRVWVWVENDRLVFKADILADTPEAIYIEGVYVRPEERGKGYGTCCLSQLGRTLLARAGALCLSANANHKAAQAFYRKAGYEERGSYDTIYLRRESE